MVLYGSTFLSLFMLAQLCWTHSLKTCFRWHLSQTKPPNRAQIFKLYVRTFNLCMHILRGLACSYQCLFIFQHYNIPLTRFSSGQGLLGDMA